MKPRITSIVQKGIDVQPVSKLKREDSALGACLKKWEHLRDEVKGKLWAQCPPEMAADFARAVARDLVTEYGPGAIAKGGQSIAIAAAERNLDQVEIKGSWLGAGAFFGLRVEFSPDQRDVDAPVEQGVEFSVVADDESDEGDVRDALRDWGKNEDSSRVRMVLDPVATLPDEDVAALVSQVEQYFKGDDATILFSSAGALLMWASMESHNAVDLNLEMAGLTRGDAYVAPGKRVAIVCKATLMDSQPNPDPVASDAKQYTVSLPKTRP